MAAENDFRGRDLRGESFRDRDLTGADFTGSDVRGADFGNARLVDAKFTDALLGVRPLTGGLILSAAFIVAVAAGIMIGFFANTIRTGITASDWRDNLGSWLLLTLAAVFFGFLIAKGLRHALWASLIALIVVVAGDFILVYSVAGELRLLNALRLLGVLLAFGLAALAGVLGRIVGGAFGAWAIGLVAVLGGIAAGRADGGVAAVIVSGLLVYISRRALKLDDRDRALRRLAHRIVTRRGTHFNGADISNADFRGTLIAESGVTHATLNDSTWENGKDPITSDHDVT